MDAIAEDTTDAIVNVAAQDEQTVDGTPENTIDENTNDAVAEATTDENTVDAIAEDTTDTVPEQTTDAVAEDTVDEQTADAIAEQTVDAVPETTVDENTVDAVPEATTDEQTADAIAEATVDAIAEDTTDAIVNVAAQDEQTVDGTPENTIDENTNDAVGETTTDENTVDALAEQTVDAIPESTIDEDTTDAIAENTVAEMVNVAAQDEQTTDEQTIDAIAENTTDEIPESTVDASESTVAENVVTEYQPEETTSVSVPPSIAVTTTLLTTVATAGEFTTVFEAESSEGEDVFSLKFDENGTTLVATNHLTNEEVSYDMTNELQNGQSHEIGMNISEIGMSIVLNGTEVSSLEFNEPIEMPTELTITEAPNLDESGVVISGLDANINEAIMETSDEEAFALLQTEELVLDLDLALNQNNENSEELPTNSESALDLNDMVSNTEETSIDLSNIVSSTPTNSNENVSESSIPQDNESPFDVLNNSGQNDALAELLNVDIDSNM